MASALNPASFAQVLANVRQPDAPERQEQQGFYGEAGGGFHRFARISVFAALLALLPK